MTKIDSSPAGRRWLVTGAGGLLGRELVEQLRSRQLGEIIALDRAALDIRDGAAVDEVLRGLRCGIVVNCAAWTNANAAETAEPEALAVNAHAVRNLAVTCAATDATLVHISTDYVFDGTARTPYAEYDTPRPVNAYGRTKLLGERAVLELLPFRGFVIRTAWVYGGHGRNFVNTMLKLEREHATIEVVNDQVGQPTWSRDLAGRIAEIDYGTAPAGIYHGTNAGRTTWWELAREVFRYAGADPDRVLPIPTSARNDPAARPPFSALGHERWRAAGLEPLRHWRFALAEAMPELAAQVSMAASTAATASPAMRSARGVATRPAT
ncbi:dTDP-4-dehydrorhamnose reductase [Nocardia sp. SYP-A9097]|uniref:dTDP-4-dehydrorhamnose reductase n=1 Tax=Nocardia sp. SYP-A9097 TaxID=2663237 RepID=UPI00129B70F8|nr:dTDP-4-dehydrorhamnose reductase [Nocardia sp. SYP-A9097]MRH86143.1 dTDP-4-dehydrorhamnose reductase [Nocardia sp. SYP-A9097]